MTRFALNVERSQPKAPQPDVLSLPEQVLAALKDRLPDDACCFAVGQEAPTIFIFHRGSPLGLHIKRARLSAVQNCCFHRLRCSGMRIEVARTFHEAMKLVAEMGVVLKPAVKSVFTEQDFFREATRRVR